MSPARTPRPPRVPRIRSDDSIGRQEDIGRLVPAKPKPAPQPNAHHDAGLPSRPPKPVRFTLDLDQERHTFLKRFALECGAGVGGAQVMRALLDELAEGANLPVRVKARISAAKR